MTKIAIIEDNQTIGRMYGMKFEADGFEVRIAIDGKAGVDLVKTFNPDIILLDIQMPEMDGAEALKLIREDEASKSTPVIILTNIGEEEAPSEMKALNVHSYIVKANYTPRQVVALVKSTIKDLV
ncbi:MAG TPA: response regulator [Candidatus Nanoperiomorbaceae bacterium]|jgi:DNA-binding response OmpR family regulator|nr:MAG: response regulator [Candidatus Saccharibacteria bacterium]HMQ09112.1 response regulator [Candidatus Nanoperiomorbaceae bacterium]HMQ96546.1 response regulator [Candidatus Nanoperiomorbaceae bacterium]HMR86358.1 response regulator [Candidatus Nanoperiomorbaceae bacterium]HMU11947.1 response regulator [Candidatus Nanoperiomorbaceae bacterium]